MVNSLLFRWEDSSALKHHCGICERPLSHPGARASCFGTHAEPCHRFHQAMFMRLRAHTCAYCLTIDEAHWKRHKEIAETLYSIYESCHEIDWSIVPSEPEERGRYHAFDAAAADGEGQARGVILEDTGFSKRERKDAKRLARAASRARVITQDEIQHVDSVIHSGEGVSGNDDEGPRNQEEIDEVEQHLRYNAHVYNTRPNTRELKKLAKLAEFTIDVDFDAEMERMLDTFRIRDLLRRNTKNRGLQGKEFKVFQTLIDDLKKAITEDLVLVKKDILEVRMRRAGYLRYTNKTAYGIVEDRYTDKDWKTGERFPSSTSDSSSAISLIVDSCTSTSDQKVNLALQPRPTTHKSDHRHLESIHKRVNGRDGLHDEVIEPYHAPLLPLLPDPTLRNKVMSLKIVAHDFPETPSSRKSAWGKKASHNQLVDGWAIVAEGKKPRTMALKPGQGIETSVHLSKPHDPESNHSSSDDADVSGQSIPTETRKALQKMPAPAVQAPAATEISSSNAPERFLKPLHPALCELAEGHPAPSQKKVKKAVREAKRKAKKVLTDDSIVDTVLVHNNESVTLLSLSAASSQDITADGIFHVHDAVGTQNSNTLEAFISDTDGAQPQEAGTDVAVTESSEFEVLEEVTTLPGSASLALTYHKKHLHWMKFTRRFTVDQLTDPSLEPWTSCAHGTACAFEKSGVIDCPFHEPHCRCVDPLYDLCYLVYPATEPCSLGPYNRLQGEKALATYEEDGRFKDRLMLIDSDLVDHFMNDSSLGPRDHYNLSIPKRLATEYADVDSGYYPGPLMEQQRQYECRLHKNKLTQHLVSRDMLQDIQRKLLLARGEVMCYCNGAMPEEGIDPKLITVCSHRDCTRIYFHKSCIKKLGVEKVSRWYCTACEKRMGVLARQVLRNLGFADVPHEEEEDDFDEANFKDMLQIPDAVYNHLKESIRTQVRHVNRVWDDAMVSTMT